jgi:hypothetical protein
VGKTSKGGALLWASEEYYRNRKYSEKLTASLLSQLAVRPSQTQLYGPANLDSNFCCMAQQIYPLILLYGPADLSSTSAVWPAEYLPLLAAVRLGNFGPSWLLYGLLRSASFLAEGTAWYGLVCSSTYSLSAAKNPASAGCPEIAPQQAAQLTQPVALFISLTQQ